MQNNVAELDYQIGIPDWLTKYIKKMIRHHFFRLFFYQRYKMLIFIKFKKKEEIKKTLKHKGSNEKSKKMFKG